MPRRLALAILLLGCGPPPPTVDAGPRDAGAPDAGPPAATGPAAPALPALAPCADGWAQLEREDGVSLCEPFPAGRPECGDDAVLVPGATGCARLGPACGEAWDDVLPPGATVRFVAPGGTGSGSSEDPYGTIADAVAASGPGDVVAVARGTYVESVPLETGAIVIGACVAETIVESPEPTRGAFEVAGAGGTIRNLTLRRGYGVLAEADVVVEDVAILGPRRDAVRLTAGTLTARRLKVVGAALAGIALEADATLEDVEIVDGYGDPVSATAGATVTARRIHVRDREGGEPTLPRFASVTGGASVTFEALAVIETHIAVFLVDPGSALTLRDAVLIGRESAPSAGGPAAEAGTSLTVERVRIHGGELFTLAAFGAGTTLRATDVILGGGRGDPFVAGRGHGIELNAGARATLTRILVEDARTVGVLVDLGAELVAEDLSVRDTRPDADGFFGRAIQVQSSATLEARRVALRGGHELQLGVASGASATIEDARLSGVAERACATTTCAGTEAGVGAGAYLGARLSLTRFVVAGGPFVGVQLSRDGAIDLADGIVSGHPIGVNIQVDGYDLERLTGGVRFVDNGRNLDQAQLPVPQPAVQAL